MPRSIAKLSTAFAVVIMLATACGGTGTAPTSASAAPATPVSLNVGVVGVIDVAPLYLGIKKGFFAKQKITITPHVLNTGATVVAGVVGGDLQLGFSNITSIVIAASRHLPLRIVAAGNQAAGGRHCPGKAPRNWRQIDDRPHRLVQKEHAVFGALRQLDR